MKTFRTIILGLLLAAMATTCNTAFAATTSELLQQGLYAEEVEGNLDSAIKTYDQVIKNGSAPPNHVAQALYREGMCYLKLKDEASARAALEKLVADYPGQTEIVEKARPILDELTDFDPATLMPAGTLAYVEFGSPGRQVETILTMLKGTPFENPLAAVTGQQATNSNQKSPGDIVAALLNPSMMAEFKKIRSAAIGVTGITNNHPPMISVLYPGKSDALRGLILAGLSMAGTPGEPIESMQTVNIKNAGAEAAYDDKVIIVAQPASQLQWCVKQYKGLISEPSLASSNKSFAKLGKAQRQKNAMTVWVNVDEAYARMLQMFPAGQIPSGILSANAIADFDNIDELTLVESVETNGLGWNADIAFKDGHHCLAYNLIRTPNINQAALTAVPAEAVALASFSLTQTDTAQADKVRTQIQNVTGLDVGREIFANVEQVTVFAMPAGGNSTSSATNVFVPDHLIGVNLSRG
jgi:tetratricopeptide (TPR) repeat protein